MPRRRRRSATGWGPTGPVSTRCQWQVRPGQGVIGGKTPHMEEGRRLDGLILKDLFLTFLGSSIVTKCLKALGIPACTGSVLLINNSI